MTYAHITAGTIDQIGPLPSLWWDGSRWWDMRTDQSKAASLGWLPVQATPRPADTATTTTDYSVALVAGIPTETWTARPKTAAEVAEATRQTVQAQLSADTTTDLTKLQTAISDLALLLADNATVGSIRAWKAPITNNATLTGAQGKALADLVITDAQATRRIARQVLRLARTMVGDYSTADVGTDI